MSTRAGKWPWPALLALGWYIGKKYGWEYKLFSLSVFHMYGCNKLVKVGSGTDNDMSTVSEKVCSLKIYANFDLSYFTTTKYVCTLELFYFKFVT